MKYLTDLRTRIGSAVFANPVMPASGTYDYFENNAGLFPMDELGAVMVKSVHRHPRSGNPMPRIAETSAGMLNAVGIPSTGIENFMAEELPRYESLHTPIVLSIAGSEPGHYAESLEIIDNDSRIAAIEMNLSCPNVGSGLPFSSDGRLIYETISQARKKTSLPLIAKLTPNITDIRVSAKTAQDAGADAITVSNTFRAMLIDIDRQRPVLGNISGGLSGPAIFAQNLFLVWQAYTAVSIPIIASGGITSWQDAVAYLQAGATALQVGCNNFVNPACMPQIVEGIDHYLFTHGYQSPEEIRGIAHG